MAACAPGLEHHRVRSAALRHLLPQPAAQLQNGNGNGSVHGPGERRSAAGATGCAVLSHLLHLTHKACLNGAARSDAASAAAVSPFVRAYDQELSRVRGFSMSSCEELWVRVTGVAQRLVQTLSACGASSGGSAGMNTPSCSVVAGFEQECDQLAEQLASLQAFIQGNIDEFASLGILHDWGSAPRTAAAAQAAAAPSPARSTDHPVPCVSAVAATLGAGSVGEDTDPGAPPLLPVSSLSAGQQPPGGALYRVGSTGASALSRAGSVGAPGSLTRAGSVNDPRALSRAGSMAWLPQDTPLVYQRCAAEHLLGGLSCDAILVGLSDLYSCLRRLRSGSSIGCSSGSSSSGGSSTIVQATTTVMDGADVVAAAVATVAAGAGTAWKPPDEFRRSTTKYWVDLSNVPRVKAMLVKHLPLLIFGRAPGVTLLTRQLKEEGGRGMSFLQDEFVRDSSKISSVYLDNAALDCYHERLRRDDRSTLVRIRWYGDHRSSKPTQQLYVERKCHRDAWVGEFSMKERAAMAQQHMADFLAGRPVPDMAAPSTAADGDSDARPARRAQLLTEIHEFITKRRQEPYLRTEYRRSAFQEEDSNAVRVSLDTSVCMLREKGAPRGAGDWCRSDGLLNQQRDIVRFPYAILEVKLGNEDTCPAWVLSLRQSGLLVEVPKFSKFLHGMAMLFPHQLANTPSWFLPSEGGAADGGAAMTPATLAEMADPGEEPSPVARWLFPAAIQPEQAQTSPEAPVTGAGCLASQPTTCNACMSAGNAGALAQQAADEALQAVVIGAQGGPAAHPFGITSPAGILPLSSGAAGGEGSPRDGGPRRAWKVQRTVAVSRGGDAGGLRDLVQRLQLAATPRRWRKNSTAGSSLELGRGPASAAGASSALLQQPPSRASALVRTRVEPKTFFAAERTFVAWLNVSVLLAFTSLSLMAGHVGMGGAAPGVDASGSGVGSSSSCSLGTACGAGAVAGAVMAPVALLFVCYALFMYRLRSRQVLRRETVRYDDQRGPLVLTAALLMVLLFAYILSVRAIKL